MKTGQVAKMLGKDSQTIIAWADRYAQFMSPAALGKDGKQRDYNDNDVMVLNTVRALGAKGATSKDVQAAMERGEFDVGLPDSAATTDISPVRIYAQNLVVAQQLEETKKELAQSRADLEAVRERYEQKLEAVEDARRRDALEREEQHKKELNDLYRKFGRLEERIEMLQEQLDGAKQSRKSAEDDAP